MKPSNWVSIAVSTFAGGSLAWLQAHNAIGGPYGVAVGALLAGMIAVVHLYQPAPQPSIEDE